MGVRCSRYLLFALRAQLFVTREGLFAPCGRGYWALCGRGYLLFVIGVPVGTVICSCLLMKRA